MDLKAQYDNTLQEFDYVIEDGQFVQIQDLETLIQVQLFTNRSADPGWTLSSNKPGVYAGWWGEAYNTDHIGSHLWQLKYLNQTDYVTYATSYVKDALQFLLTYNLCDNFTVECQYQSGRLSIAIQVTKGFITTNYDYVWTGV